MTEPLRMHLDDFHQLVVVAKGLKYVGPCECGMPLAKWNGIPIIIDTDAPRLEKGAE